MATLSREEAKPLPLWRMLLGRCTMRAASGAGCVAVYLVLAHPITTQAKQRQLAAGQNQIQIEGAQA
jgi:hypothetical protein